MARIIKFPGGAFPSQVKTLKRLSDRIDDVLIDALNHEDVEPRDVAGLLAHRLGTLISSLEDSDQILAVCQQIAAEQAAPPPKAGV